MNIDCTTYSVGKKKKKDKAGRDEEKHVTVHSLDRRGFTNCWGGGEKTSWEIQESFKSFWKDLETTEASESWGERRQAMSLETLLAAADYVERKSRAKARGE